MDPDTARDRTCTSCRQSKPIDTFLRSRRALSGYAPICRPCNAKKGGKWRAANPERNRQQQARYRAENREKCKEADRRWRRDNPEAAWVTLWLSRMKYPDARRARKMLRDKRTRSASPPWLTADHKRQMESMYWLARICSEGTGVQHHVDHIVPISSPVVCGLHVPWNLQVITARENHVKSNKLGVIILDVPTS